MTTLKEILASLNVDENVINMCPEMNLYSENEFTEITGNYEKKLNEAEINSAVNTLLIKNGAKNNVAVKALLDFDKVKLENGKISGLEEQIANIRKENEYLFKTENKLTAGNHISLSSNDFDSMSDEQYYSIKYRKEN